MAERQRTARRGGGGGGGGGAAECGGGRGVRRRRSRSTGAANRTEAEQKGGGGGTGWVHARFARPGGPRPPRHPRPPHPRPTYEACEGAPPPAAPPPPPPPNPPRRDRRPAASRACRRPGDMAGVSQSASQQASQNATLIEGCTYDSQVQTGGRQSICASRRVKVSIFETPPMWQWHLRSASRHLGLSRRACSTLKRLCTSSEVSLICSIASK